MFINQLFGHQGEISSFVPVHCMYIKNRLLNFISAQTPAILKCRVYRSFTLFLFLGPLFCIHLKFTVF